MRALPRFPGGVCTILACRQSPIELPRRHPVAKNAVVRAEL